MVAFNFHRPADELKDRIQRLSIGHLGTAEGLAGMFDRHYPRLLPELAPTTAVYSFLKCSVLTEVLQRLLIDRNSKKSGLSEAPL
jgi:DNA helicase-2/ATP-dependent DNA helicase PcrA